jgi:hypothetical protein
MDLSLLVSALVLLFAALRLHGGLAYRVKNPSRVYFAMSLWPPKMVWDIQGGGWPGLWLAGHDPVAGNPARRCEGVFVESQAASQTT